MKCQKILLDTFDALVDNTANAGWSNDDNLTNSNIDMDTKIKSNFDENIIGKNNNDNFCKNDLVIDIKELFQQVKDQIACKKPRKKSLKQTYKIF